MENQKLILEVLASSPGADASLKARDSAVRQAKRDVWAEVHAMYPGLEVSGLNSLFPVMVISGPSDLLQSIRHGIMAWLPNRVRRVESAWTANLL